jgi:hypothetical protein
MFPARPQRDVLTQCELPARIERQRSDQAAHHVVVAQALAGIFAGADRGIEIVLIDGQPGLGAGRRRRDLSAYRHPGSGCDVQFDGDARAGARLGRGIKRTAAAAPVPTVAQELRGIDRAGARQRRHGVLALRKLLAGEAIRPAQAIPVVDMEGQRHQASGVGPGVLEARQAAVGGRTGIAALRGIEFEQHVARGAGVGTARGCRHSRRGRRQAQAGGENQER